VSDLGAAALELARQGFAVFPLVARRKKPVTEHGFYDATTDAETVAGWWKSWPAANIGIRCGRLVVLDADGPQGAESLAALEAQHGPLPATRSVRTGREGGRHLYFHAPAGTTIRTIPTGRELGAKLECRATGAYVVAPPSVHPNGTAYEWGDHEAPIAELPAWLAELAAEKPKPEPKPATGAPAGEATGAYGRAALHGECEAVRSAAEGGRNHALNASAFRLGQLIPGGYLERGQVEDALRAAGLAAGLGERETDRTIRSGLDAGMLEPRGPEARTGPAAGDAAVNGDRDHEPADPDHPDPDPDPAAVIADLFVTARELRAQTPPEPPWIWHDYMAAGTVTLLAGSPKAGKSTLAVALVEALAAGERDFLGHRLEGGPVLVVSEEAGLTLRDKLTDRENVHVLPRDPRREDGRMPDVWPPAWDVLLDGAAVEARRRGAALVVLDTFGHWSRLGAEAENDAGAVHAAMQPLGRLAAETGAAVLVVLHQRKGGGEHGEAVAGSHRIIAAADVVLELERPADAPATMRQLVALGRWPQTPAALVVEYRRTTREWLAVGTAEDRRDAGRLAARERLVQVLPETGEGMTLDDLAAVLGQDRRKWSTELHRLVDDGRVSRSGEGVRGDPYRHLRIPSPDSVPDRGTETDGNASRIPSLYSVPNPLRGSGIETDPNTESPNPNGAPQRDGIRTATPDEQALFDRLEAEGFE